MRISPLDKLFSQFIRMRAIQRVGGCERCLTPKSDITMDNGSIFPGWKQLQCSHFWGRKRQLVRYDEANGAGICGACHLYLSANPSEHTAWFKLHLGEREFDLLEGRAAQIGKVDIVDCITQSKSLWFVGKYGFVLANPTAYSMPIPYKGQLGFFEVL